MSHWISAQGQLMWVKNSKNYLLCDVNKRKPHAQTKYFMF